MILQWLFSADSVEYMPNIVNACQAFK